MHLIEISRCSKALNFKPRAVWPEALPAVAWREQLLCGFGRAQGMALNYEGDFEKLSNLLVSCYQRLTLSELARLFQVLQTSRDDKKMILNSFGFRPSEELLEVLQILPSLPEEFQNWTEDKDLSLKDLQILRLSQNLKELNPVLSQLAHFSPSKNDGVMALEWIVELQAQGKNFAPLSTWSAWTEKLKLERLPMASEMDFSFEKHLQTLPWPQNAQGRWSRRGDQTGVEIKLFVKSQTEADKKLAQIKDLKLWS